MKSKKTLYIILAIVILGLSGFVYYNYYFVFGEGVKAGQLNYVVKKGYLFKTYEGKLIQTGFRTGQPGAIQSNEFEFSVTNDSIAEKMMLNSGKTFELHYKEYVNRLPWRGYSPFVVDKIISIK
ncbi:hypothetical protein FBD94_12335 [Pedobacter hiemivivus]|jgi:hypothetical protein|uniref:6-phosphogluconate dehydrogenase n=1 Tax=Pedobacter hiemivivus TaxID=2530454 RepID=A0A4R0N8X1_9SPHI|nr:hypothetical protein [Pedobacter hiemivivus]TCC95803.1 hypothetical protein EZ444_14395 [Pedobacter hiemivivus]TKC61323.1 hypothetical protein FBD94_12335 [Pedobacter hiemivivus]